jgi:glycosyltransferase involved in cell wall biosynthesis/uncharacterized membrane protein
MNRMDTVNLLDERTHSRPPDAVYPPDVVHPLRIGLIAYGLDRPRAGIGRYTLELARALAELGEALEVTLLAAGGAAPLAGLRSLPLPGCGRMPGLLTLGNVLIPLRARQLDLDVVHDPTGVAPFLFGGGGARTVVTVHDVFPRSCPGTSTLLERILCRHWLPRRLPAVDAVLTASQTSRTDIARYLGLLPSRIHVIPLGVGDRFRPVPWAQMASALSRAGLAPGYILFVGSAEKRKNLDRLLRAYARLRAFDDMPPLAIAGPARLASTSLMKVIQDLELAGHVIVIGYIPDADLPALYSGASLFVFPSLYEGFGLPPLEAMACGVPVVCSNAASLPEVVGDAALTVDPCDVEALAWAMHRVLADPELAADLRVRGLARSGMFTWERTTQETVAVYHRVLEPDHQPVRGELPRLRQIPRQRITVTAAPVAGTISLGTTPASLATDLDTPRADSVTPPPPPPLAGRGPGAWRIRNEFLPIAVLGLLLLGLIAWTPSVPGGMDGLPIPLAAARLVLGVAFVLFVPGYALQAALFPRADALGGPVRLALSFGLSLAAVPPLALVLDRLPWGLGLWPIVAAEGLVIAVCSTAAWRRRCHLPKGEQFMLALGVDLKGWWSAQDRTGRFLYGVLAGALLLALASALVLVALPKSGERFTEFYLLGPEGLAEGYPRQVVVGAPLTATLGIANREGVAAAYWIEIRTGEELVGTAGPLRLEDGESWEVPIRFTLPRAGVHQPVDLLLYRNGGKQPYRSLRLWIDGTSSVRAAPEGEAP